MATQKEKRKAPRQENGSRPGATMGPKNTALAMGSPVRVKVWAQDPLVEPGLVEIEIPGADLETGPKDSQFIVLDQDISSGVTYEQAHFSSGSFDKLEPEDIRFHQINAFAVARSALDLIEASIGRQVHWAFGPQLIIYPHYLHERNAFYSRDLGALAFFYFDIAFKEGKVFTCLSHDIVAHELGHAALDGLKPLYLEAFHAETGAFHESFGDFTAIFSALALPEVVANVISATNGNLREPSIAAMLAEEFGYGIYGPGHFFLRNANDPVKFSTLQSYEVHDFSVLLTATLFEILTEFYERNRSRTDEQLSDVEALIAASRHLRRITYRAINYLPPTSVTFRRFGQAMIAADKRAFPNDEQGYRDIIKRVFAAREIVQNPEQLETQPQLQLDWDGKLDQRSLYQFIYRNRAGLGIPTDPSIRLNYPTAASVDLSWVQTAGAAQIQETVVEYSYTQEISFMGLCSYFVNFGGTLVFDENRQVVAHFAEPEQPGGQGAVIDQGLEFYHQVKERKQIRALTWRRLDKKPADATFLLYRLPDSRGQTRLNICTRFGAKSVDMPNRRIVHADLTGLIDEVEEPALM